MLHLNKKKIEMMRDFGFDDLQRKQLRAEEGDFEIQNEWWMNEMDWTSVILTHKFISGFVIFHFSFVFAMIFATWFY